MAVRKLLKTVEIGLLDEKLVLNASGLGFDLEDNENEANRAVCGGDSVTPTCDDENGDGNDDSNGADRWKLSVHSLNVLRLLFIDSTLGLEADTHVGPAFFLAVSGFKSRRWAVRNSSMMLFSALVQRVVDSDRNSTAGPGNVNRAVTAAQFFERFPSLFPFMLRELADVVNFAVEFSDSTGWPVRVAPIGSNLKDESVEEGERMEVDPLPPNASIVPPDHPTLYPMLLLMSKFRPCVDLSSRPQESSSSLTALGSSSSGSGGGGGGSGGSANSGLAAADTSLFSPLVESCRGMPLQPVRLVAAKALAGLTPVQDVPGKAAELLEALRLALLRKQQQQQQSSSGSVCVVSTNELHGYLLQVHELLQGLARHWTVLETNADGATLRQQLLALVVPAFDRLVRMTARMRVAPLHHSMMESLVSSDSDNVISVQTFISILYL
jgi:uncharacterized membrane protein YgcG